MKTAKQRLEKYRATAAKFNSDWRKCRWNGSFAYGPSYGWQQDGVTLWADNNDALGRVVGDAHNIIRIDHTGWFCDHIQHELCRGAVIKLRCSRGTYYIAMTYMTDSDAACIHMDSKYLVEKGADEEEHKVGMKEAAWWADQEAEHRAEQCREDDLRYAADTEIDSLLHQNKLATEKIKSLIGAVRESAAIHPTLCNHLKESIRKLLQERRHNFEWIGKYRKEPHLILD